MNYTEITIQIQDNQDIRERLMADLLAIGYNSFMETEKAIAAYIETRLFDKNRVFDSLKVFHDKAKLEKIEELPDKNWNAIWESNYEPVNVDSRCLVRAPFHSKPDGIEYDIVIHPKMSFGTAHHETTYLMLQVLLENDFRGKRILDIGSGTGVLAIMASRRGAEKVVAIDNDEWAYFNALENCELNDIKNIDVILGDALAIPEGEYDVLLANINRNILLDDIGHYNRHLINGATVYLSGFYENDLPVLRDEAGKFGWRLLVFNKRNNWIVASFRVCRQGD